MPVLGIDIETYSSVDLRKSTVYRYAEAPDFEILLFAYAIDDEPVTQIDLTRESMPSEVIGMLSDPQYIKKAFNANFERVCLSEWLRRQGYLSAAEMLNPAQWQCTMVQAAMLGLPRSLGDVGKVLRLEEDKQKMKEGKALIQYFCKPCKATKVNGGRTRNLPRHAPDKWATFCAYNVQDVEAERAIRHKIEEYPVPEDEWLAYAMDQEINDRGVRVDTELMDAAIQMNYEHAAELTQEAVQRTGLANAKSVAQLKGWLGHEGSLDKKAIQKLRQGELDENTDRVLAIRQELGKTSVTKYEAMKRGICADGRVKGLFAFYGASRTGRWAGRQVQVQNLPQNHIPDLGVARRVVRDGDRSGLQALFGNVPATLSELIRTAFVAEKGKTFCVADFNAIEARVVAWLAGEQWRIENFKRGGDIYCASASQMFGVPVEKNGVNGHLRQKGKIAELALGYGGGVGALTSMGALEMGLKSEELQPLVDMWRESNPAIVRMWWQIDRAAKETVGMKLTDWRYDLPHGLSMRMSGSLLHVKLPSGRILRYFQPRLEKEGFRENISYGSTEAGTWGRVNTYGPKLFENIVQAIARDCLRDAMLSVRLRYPGIVMHIHDEMVVEVPEDQAETALKDILQIMARPVPWAPGLLLKGAGYTTEFYKKD